MIEQINLYFLYWFSIRYLITQCIKGLLHPPGPRKFPIVKLKNLSQNAVQPIVQNKQTPSSKKQIDQIDQQIDQIDQPIVQMASPKEQETSQTDDVQPIFQPTDQIPLSEEQQARQTGAVQPILQNENEKPEQEPKIVFKIEDQRVYSEFESRVLVKNPFALNKKQPKSKKSQTAKQLAENPIPIQNSSDIDVSPSKVLGPETRRLLELYGLADGIFGNPNTH